MKGKDVPAYPFPDDEIVYVDRRVVESFDKFTIDGDSYMALGRMPEPKTYTDNGVKHTNTHRLCFHTPSKGSMCLLVCPKDAMSLIRAGVTLHSEEFGRVDMRDINKYDWMLDGDVGVNTKATIDLDNSSSWGYSIGDRHNILDLDS